MGLSAFSWDVGLLPSLGLERKHQLFFGLKPANFSTEIYFINSLVLRPFGLELELKGDSGEI